MDKTTVKAFVLEYTESKVTCRCLVDEENGYTEDRIFDMNFFAAMDLYKGKNVWFEIVIEPPSMTMSCFESKRPKMVQLENFWVHKTFDI